MVEVMKKMVTSFKRSCAHSATLSATLSALDPVKEAEDITKRWQEYTEELYKKDLHDLHHSLAPGKYLVGNTAPAINRKLD